MASPPKSGSMLWPQTPAAQQPWAPRGSGGGGGGGGLINTLAAAYLSGPGLHHTRRHSMAHLAAAVDDGESKAEGACTACTPVAALSAAAP